MSLFDRKKEFWAKFEASVFEVINLALRYLKTKDTCRTMKMSLIESFIFA